MAVPKREVASPIAELDEKKGDIEDAAKKPKLEQLISFAALARCH